MNLPLFSIIALTIVLGFVLRQLQRLRREQRELLEGLPTGLCVIDDQHRIRRWNTPMSKLSGISADDAQGRVTDALPDPWPEAFSRALVDDGEQVIKQGVSDGKGGQRWVILHSSASYRRGQRRFVLVEEITEYQRLQDELLHQERLASIGRLAAGVAHEIGNPVTGIACVAQNLAEGTDAAELEQGTAEILKQTDRITRTVGALMQLSHPGSTAQAAECVPCNLADCIDEAIHLLTLDRDAPADGFDNRCDREMLVSADAQLLLQVMLNLLDNARSASSGESAVIVDAREEDDKVILAIDNPGPVIARAVIDQVFEPFFTTKDVGEGTGLGLPLVRRMLNDMGGSIVLLSPIPEHDSGTRVQLSLERADYTLSYALDP